VHVEGTGRKRPHHFRWLGLGLLLAALGGCSKDVDVLPLTESEQRLTHVAMAYADAHAELNRGPKNAEELKRFLKPFGDPDALLVSPNDGQPYVVVWGANPTGGPTDYRNMFPILAYERKGADGKRVIVDVRGCPLTIPEEDLSKLKFVGRHKPSQDGP
jgi:hypothetical protein